MLYCSQTHPLTGSNATSDGAARLSMMSTRWCAPSIVIRSMRMPVFSTTYRLLPKNQGKFSSRWNFLENLRSRTWVTIFFPVVFSFWWITADCRVVHNVPATFQAIVESRSLESVAQLAGRQGSAIDLIHTMAEVLIRQPIRFVGLLILSSSLEHFQSSFVTIKLIYQSSRRRPQSDGGFLSLKSLVCCFQCWYRLRKSVTTTAWTV